MWPEPSSEWSRLPLALLSPASPLSCFTSPPLPWPLPLGHTAVVLTARGARARLAKLPGRAPALPRTGLNARTR